MKEKVVNKILDFIKKHKTLSDKDIKIQRYGLEALYNLTTKTIVLIIINTITNSLIEYLLLTLFYAIIRLYAFGIHAKTSLGCWISTLSVYILGANIIKYIQINNTISIVIIITSIISFILWAPADTPKRPIIRESQRKKMKIKSLIIAIVYSILIIFIKNQLIIRALTLSLFIEEICINPITYKILKTQFNNYKYYKNGLN